SLLADLRVEPVGEALLPGKPVAVGESWGADVDRLLEFLAPGGTLGHVPQEGGSQLLERTLRLGCGGLVDSLWNRRELDGLVTCTLMKVEGSAPNQRAIVQVEFRCRTSMDRTAQAQALRSAIEIRTGTQVEQQTSSFAVEGRGELVWDLGQNRAQSFRLVGNEEWTLVAVMRGADGLRSTQVFKLEGTGEQGYRAIEPTGEEPKSWTENPKEREESKEKDSLKD
ncbi:MAG: hypothetical protein KDB61_13205, partial [Planctomycetes bacterium]|nr:hypothetical protein [Planctomycetota bacterium]